MEMKPAFLSVVSSQQFAGLNHEDPYSHLSNFYELCSTMCILEGDEEAVYLRLFPSSLTGKATIWLKSHPNQSLTSWSDVENKFVNRFYPSSKYIKAKLEIITFRQGMDEPFCETWERFKSLLRKCPNHGFEDIAQLNFFVNGIKPEVKMLLDATASSTMMSVGPEEATQIIESLASSDLQAEHGRHQSHKRGIMDLSTNDAILAQNKLLSQQIEALTKKMAKIPQQILAINSPPVQSNPPLRCDFFGESTQMVTVQKILMKKKSIIWVTKKKEKNTEASIKNLEVQVGQLAKQLADMSEGPFSANTKTNPKEHCQSMTTRSGKVVGSDVGVSEKNERVEKEENVELREVEEEIEKNEEESNKNEGVDNEKPVEENKEESQVRVAERGVLLGERPVLRVERAVLLAIIFFFFINFFTTFYVGFVMSDVNLRRICYMSDVNFTEEKPDEKPVEENKEESQVRVAERAGSFTLPVSIGNLSIGMALLDLGASINLMPLSMLKKIGDVEVRPTRMTLQLADRSVKFPHGIVEDTIVKVDKFMFLVDFVVMDMEEDIEVPLILGRPFMKIARVIIDMDDGKLKVRVQDEEESFNVFEEIKFLKANKDCFRIDVLDDLYLETQNDFKSIATREGFAYL
uniref:Retrotransposon gag domain-containing protein n=1 Tax=Cajanus cajan TaxID=3821 RepID=A0A151S8V0_CAJCA|nr:hypothetical protein KK1_026996 [Cajanus cajan]